MPPIDELTTHSLREYGLFPTMAILGMIFVIVYTWRRPPPSPHASPMHAVEEKVKLIPLILEEVRLISRKQEELRNDLERHEERLERMERIGEVLKDRQGR